MKKIVIALATILIVCGVSVSAFAFGPGWQSDYRHYQRVGFQPAPFPFYDHHPVGPHPQVVYVPVRPPRPVVQVMQPVRPGIVISIPNFSLWIR